MRSCSEGSAYPRGVSRGTDLAPHLRPTPSHTTTPAPLLTGSQETTDLGAACLAGLEAAERRNAADGQRGHSWALPGRAPTVCWTSRSLWLVSVDVALHSDEGRRLCRQRHLSPVTARAIARGVAAFADTSSGRNVTASNSTIAALAAARAGRPRPWSHDVVANTRAVLTALGLAVEVARGRYLTHAERLAAAVHHGGQQLRAASTWALTSPRRWMPKSSLPRRGSTGSKTPRSRKSPTRAQARATAPSGRSSRQGAPPRPIEAHKVTAELIQRTHGLDTGHHLGALVDVVHQLVDCRRWTGRDLAEVLNAHAMNNPRDWPSRIHYPAAFLRSRLTEISDQLARISPSQQRAEAHHKLLLEQAERRREQQEAAEQRATPHQVANHLAAIRATLAARKERR